MFVHYLTQMSLADRVLQGQQSSPPNRGRLGEHCRESGIICDCKTSWQKKGDSVYNERIVGGLDAGNLAACGDTWVIATEAVMGYTSSGYLTLNLS